MGSSTYNDASQKQLEDELIDAGSRLLILSSSIDELLSLLQKAEKLLIKVRQQPPRSTGDALLPVMKALVTDDLLRHVDVNVQVAVASCINELTRITAPNPPYSDDEMKEVFRLFMIAFKQLPCESGPNYSRAAQILETVAKVRSCLILLDIDCDALVLEMFQLFFSTVRCSQPSNILKYMEMIMILVLEESDEISLELLRSLLTSVRKDCENISPVSFELGKTVFKKCRTKLEPRLREAVETMNLDVADYAEIFSSLSEDLSNGNNMVAKEAASAGKTTEIGLSSAGISKLDGLSKTELEDSSPLNKEDSGNEQPADNYAGSDNKEVGAAEMLQTEMDNRAARKRGRKPKSFIKPREGHEGKDSCEVSCNVESDNDLALASKPGNASELNYSSHKEYDSANEGSLRRRGRSKMKESIITQGSNLELTSTPKSRILRTAVKEKGSSASKGTDKKNISGSRIIKAKKEENLDTEIIGKLRINTQKHESEDILDKMVESPVSGASRAKRPRNLPSKTEKISKGSRVDYGEEVVNLRIQVWWPMDKAFYPGTVKAFDPVSKKHKINYDDGEEEILNLRKERWEILNDKKPGQAHLLRQQEADHTSHTKGPTKSQKNTTKRRVFSPRKQNATPSAKRSKSESHHGESEVVDNSALDVIHQKGEITNKDTETEASTKHDEDILAGKEELETAIDKMEPDLNPSNM
ncbi:sister chromatid cohesion protein PDS5 homolog D-like isoform X1 [Primulina tabacum]|uniref:sister chromatid cohesion protein PDS5 homolog D-like isoform X1 n=1 Tax=Primulina tabacum TaxID=48773 RepID=UPI003F5A362B